MKNKHSLRKLGRNTDLRRHLFRCVLAAARAERGEERATGRWA
jgi:hypothetical protein